MSETDSFKTIEIPEYMKCNRQHEVDYSNQTKFLMI